MTLKPFAWTLLIFIALSCQETTSQNVKAKSIPPESIDRPEVSSSEIPVLTGTAVLAASEKNMTSRTHGLYLDTIYASPCSRPSEETPSRTEVTSVSLINDSTLVMSANVFANCSYSFLGEIEVVNDNTINLIYHGYGSYAMCNCCFGLTYRISLFRDDDTDFSKIRFVTIDGVGKKDLPRIQ